jgi:hypothetical protein
LFYIFVTGDKINNFFLDFLLLSGTLSFIDIQRAHLFEEVEEVMSRIFCGLLRCQGTINKTFKNREYVEVAFEKKDS